MVRRISSLGRRGGFLLILAVLQAVIGWSILVVPPIAFQGLTVFRDIPQWALVAYWFTPAVLGCLAAFLHRRTRLDGPSFSLSYITMFVWGFAYVVSWVPFNELGAGVAFRSAIIYWAFAALILLVSGWSENLPLANEAKMQIPPIPRK